MKKRYNAHISRANWIKWLIIGIFSGGVIIGLIAAQALDAGSSAEIGQELLDNLPKGQSARALSLAALQANSWEMFKIFLAGLFLGGSIFIAAYIFFKGFALGFTALFLLLTDPWQDMMITLGTIIAPQILFTPLMLVAAIIMFETSLQIFFYTKGELLKEVLRSLIWLFILMLLTVLVSMISGGLAFRLLA